LCPDPASVAVLAASAESIAAHVDVPASLHVGAAGHDPASRPGALEISIVIHNFPNTTAIVIESSLPPSATEVFTPGINLVAAYTYVPARLGVRPTWPLASTIRLYVPAPVPVVSSSAATEPSVIIYDAAVTIVESLQVGCDPAATEVLTHSAESVIVPPYVSTGFYVRTARQRSSFIADQTSVVVGDIAPAPVRSIEIRVTPSAVLVFANGTQIVAAHPDVPAGLAVGPGRSFHRSSFE